MTDLLKVAQELSEADDEFADYEGEEYDLWRPESEWNVPSARVVEETQKLLIREAIGKDGTRQRVMEATPSGWISSLIYLNGSPFSFTGRDYLLPIYNSGLPRVLLKTGRQVEKSTLLANSLVVNSAVRPFFKSLYVSPSHSQTRQFSNEKLKTAMEQSPFISRYLINHMVSSQVFEKGFANGSMIFMRSAFLTADRARGISSDLACIDELQDMLISNIPVILECLSHSRYKYQKFAGTPKSLENTIEQYWQYSSQCEWMVPCGCKGGEGGRFWNFLDDKNIHKTKGVVCKRCGKKLDVARGRWAAANAGSTLTGFRIPQLMVPWIINRSEDWQELVYKYETYPTAQFHNEVLGLSYDSSSKPITRAEVQACCDSKRRLPSGLFDRAAVEDARGRMTFMGIDWGEGRDGGKTPTGKVAVASYTVITICAYVGNKFRVLFCKRYEGKEIDPDFVVEEAAKLAVAWGVKLVGVDYGHGWGVNNQLVRKLTGKKVVQFFHIPKLKERRRWNQRGSFFELNRNLIMSELFLKIKQQLLEFPRWEDFAPFAKDILHIFAEYCEYARTLKYDHKPSEPDDFFHSLLFCWQAANIYLGRKD